MTQHHISGAQHTLSLVHEGVRLAGCCAVSLRAKSVIVRGVQQGDQVAYAGSDKPDLMLWHGHPGRIVDLGQYPTEVGISFVNGPSLYFPLDQVEGLHPGTYREGVQRVLGLRHPTDPGRSVPQFWATLEPWPEDEILEQDNE